MGKYDSWVCMGVAYPYSRTGHQNLTLNSGTETTCKYIFMFSEGVSKCSYAIFKRYHVGNPFSFNVDTPFVCACG